MARNQPCFLCGKTYDIEPITDPGIQTPWRSFCQFFSFDSFDSESEEETETSTVNAYSVDLSRSRGTTVANNSVHSACWSVVAKVFDLGEIDQEWLTSFRRCFEDISPFLTVIPFSDYSPGTLDDNIHLVDGRTPEACTRSQERLPCARNNTACWSKNSLPLPVEIVQYIYELLDNYRDVLNLQQVTAASPSVRNWLALGRGFCAFENSSFTLGSRKQIASRIERALWNVYSSPTKFPHTVNYGVVWRNAESILLSMSDTNLGTYTILPPPRFHILHQSLTTYLPPYKITPPLVFPSALVLRFRRVGRTSILCGLTIGDHTAGYRGDSQEIVKSEGLCGL